MGGPMSRREDSASVAPGGAGWSRRTPMIPIARMKASFPRVAALVEPHFDVLRKAVSFGLIGVINVVVDTSVLFLARSWMNASETVLWWFDALAQWCSWTS